MCSSSALDVGLGGLQHLKEPGHHIAYRLRMAPFFPCLNHSSPALSRKWKCAISAGKRPSMSSGKTWASMPKAFAEVARLIAQGATPMLAGQSECQIKEHIRNGIN